jgi:[ribosomal protein S5]-alanine N-acetyltransferase
MDTEEKMIFAQDEEVILRELLTDDVPHLASLANNSKVGINLRNTFPHPYTCDDAAHFIKLVRQGTIETVMAIQYLGEYAGNIGITRGTDVYFRSAEIGYFIGEPFWNKGITTRAVNLMTQWVFESTNIVRLYAGVFDYNHASQRVLEKCGYKKEAVFEKAVFKNGKFYHEIRYARIKS